MLHTNEKIIKNKVGLLNLAEVLQNISRACMLTDRGTEFCGKTEQHDYELYLAINDMDHTKTKAHHPQTNGICERFHKTILDEFYKIAFRKKIYSALDVLQKDLDDWLVHYNNKQHQGKMCCSKANGYIS